MAEPMSREEIIALPSVVGIETAGRALGFERNWAYQLVKKDRFPVPVRRVGKRYRVPTAFLLEYLGLTEPDHARDIQPSTSNGNAHTRRAISSPDHCSSSSYRSASGKPIDPDKVYRVGADFITGAQILEMIGE